MGRIRLRRIADASAASLEAFVEEAIQPGSLVHTDGWEGYAGLENKGYRHEVNRCAGSGSASNAAESPSCASLLKRAVGARGLSVTSIWTTTWTSSRSDRRTSRSRGKLFYRLLQQAVAGPCSL